jgi:hypothetical protein
MAQQRTKPQQLGVVGSDVAPVIYTNGAYAWGVNDGSVQIELGVTTMVPVDGQLRNRVVCAGHLRAGLTAAKGLRDSLDAAIEQAEQALDAQADTV